MAVALLGRGWVWRGDAELSIVAAIVIVAVAVTVAGIEGTGPTVTVAVLLSILLPVVH